MPTRLFTPRQICDRFNVSRATFYRMLKSGKLRAVKLGHKTLVPDEEAHRLLASLDQYRPAGHPIARRKMTA